LSRFDILCVVQDVVDPLADEQLAQFIVESHRRSIPSASSAGGSAGGGNNDNTNVQNVNRNNNGVISNDATNHQTTSLSSSDTTTTMIDQSSNNSAIESDNSNITMTNNTHRSSNQDPLQIPQDLLKKYIIYAKKHFQPQCDQRSAIQPLEKVYSEMRAESKQVSISKRFLFSFLFYFFILPFSFLLVRWCYQCSSFGIDDSNCRSSCKDASSSECRF
jgi:DNA replicative helicase MCM subunit Mcm2 (Cdc46/Mcm family)